MDKASATLAALVQPAGDSVSAPLHKNVVHDIWEKVLQEGACLHGNFDVTCSGACEAAHRRDWPLCAYLAAMCCRREGESALAERSCRWQDDAWLQVLSPILVDVPLGRERLRVRIDDAEQEEWIPTDQTKRDGLCGNRIGIKGRGRATFCRAEYFKEGGTVQPVKFKRVLLPEDVIVDLRHRLKSGNREDHKPSSLDDLDRYPLSHIPGIWYHVLAYPFAGDVTKALLRPKADAWTQLQRNALLRLSETLISKCAKAGKWDLVETLLAAGVRCPDLTREFESICNHTPVAHEAWRQDLQIACGVAHGRASLLELAAWHPVPTEWKDAESSPLQVVTEALHISGQDLDFGGGSNGRLPLIRTAAERGRWDIVLDLLLAKEVNVCAGSLLKSRAMASAPPKVRLLVEERARQEKMTAATKASHSLKDYFARQLSGPVPDSVPSGFQKVGEILEGKGGLRVLDCCFKLGPRQGKEHIFVRLEPDEMEKAEQSMNDPTVAVLALDLHGRECSVNEPSPDRGNTCWIFIRSQANYLKTDESGAITSICIPPNQLTYAHIMRRYPVRVTVVSPCCEEPLEKVPVYVCGNHVGTTNREGVVAFQLSPGRFTIASPGFARAEETLDVASDQTEGVEVRLIGSGEIFIYLASMGDDDDPKDGVMLCTNRDHIDAEEAACFVGTATMPECRGLFIPKGKRCTPTTCYDKMSQMRIKSTDGRAFEKNDELIDFFDESKHECLMALLFNTTQKRVGDLKGPRPQECDPLRAAIPSAVPTPMRAPGPPVVAFSSTRPPRPAAESVNFDGKLRSSGLIFQSNSKPPLGKFVSPTRKRLPTPDSRPVVGAVSQRRPRSANPSLNPSRVQSVDSSPRSASRGRSSSEFVATYGGKALSLRSLRLNSH